MSFNFSSDSLHEIHKVLMMTLHDDYDYQSSPRGKPIKELIAASFTLTNPRNRLIMSPARAVNYGFAVGELCWYIRGDNDLATMSYYNKRMRQFSDDGKTINSAYGHRMFTPNLYSTVRLDAFSQFENLIEELKKDPDSRRAVMHINQPRDLARAVDAGSKDVPCTMSVQLLIRDKKLHMHVLMRSNDVVWGLPYDVFSFTCLQEAFLYSLQEAGVEVDGLGHYHHTAGSLHVYDTHFALAEEVSKEPELDVTPMGPFTFQGLSWLADIVEPKVRASAANGSKVESFSRNPESFIEDLGFDRVCYAEPTTIEWMLERIFDHRDKRVIEQIQFEEREKALTELARLTEEAGGYDDLKEKT